MLFYEYRKKEPIKRKKGDNKNINAHSKQINIYKYIYIYIYIYMLKRFFFKKHLKGYRRSL